jgi:hypothetical protein
MATAPEYLGRHAAQRKPAGLGDLVGGLFRETRALVSDYAQLAVLDARRAAIRLAWLLGSGLMVAVLLVTAWMAGVAASIVWMWDEGWPAAIGVAALINIVGAGALVWWMLHLVHELPFTALLRQLRGDPPPPEGTR